MRMGTSARPLLPPMPDLSRGVCVTGALPGAYWTSKLNVERSAARLACTTCPVLEACRAWSMNLPASDATIYGGMTAKERVGRKREAARIRRSSWRRRQRPSTSA